MRKTFQTAMNKLLQLSVILFLGLFCSVPAYAASKNFCDKTVPRVADQLEIAGLKCQTWTRRADAMAVSYKQTIAEFATMPPTSPDYSITKERLKNQKSYDKIYAGYKRQYCRSQKSLADKLKAMKSDCATPTGSTLVTQTPKFY